uniref:Progestin and adipoQ receptor family member 6 n=2 Tax=Capra hircus TaxID=9925 RepID=A0A8C2QSG5_CAPHI
MLSLKLPQLLRVHQVPRVFWEDGIMSGYRRPTSSALDCVLSSFQMTNETVNIWTHFLPTWYFLWRLLALAGGLGFRSEPYHWPLLVFLLPACLYPFASCCAHTFSSMSPRVRHICYFLDYGALSLYSLGCAFPYAAYSMPASWLHSHLHQLFVPAAALNSFLCTGLSCYSRFPELESPGLSKILRSAAFVYPFLFDNLPLFYRLGLCWGRGHSCGQEALSTSHGYHLFCALLTGFLFASHLPERLAPGRFDYIGDLPNPRIKPTPPALQAKPLPLSRWGSLQLDQTWKLRSMPTFPHVTSVSTEAQHRKRCKSLRGLPWRPRGSESAWQRRGRRFNPRSRKTPHATRQLSLRATTTEPVLWSP